MYALDNTIYIGSVLSPLHTFGNSDIVLNSAKGDFSVDTIGNELAVDEFSVTVRYDAANYLVYTPSNAADGYVDAAGRLYAISSTPTRGLLSLAYATPVIWYVGGAFYRKGYLKSVERVGKYAWTLVCMSGVGLLDTQLHPGRLYAGQTFAAVMAEIVGGAFAYTIDADVAGTPIVGWLPYDTARANLHRLLFATGASLIQGTESSDYTVKFLTATTVNVPDNRIALGGRVTYTTPANRVEVTEHEWIATADDEQDKLFDNTGGVAVAGQLVVFTAPVYGLEASGSLTVDLSGDNYAVVTGIGILTGKRYLHTTRVVALGTGSGTDSVKTVSDNGLVNTLNSRNVAGRILDYYSAAMEVEARILMDGEKCGDCLAMNNAFGEAITAFLKRVSVSVTSVKAARCELVEGYTPGRGGNAYTDYTIIDADGTFTVPAGVTALRLVLVGGGDGGQGGTDGQDGYGGDADQGGDLTPVKTLQIPIGYVYSGGEQGVAEGGEAGEAGLSGRLLIVDVAVTPGETLTLAIGAGGSGGAAGGGSGSAGSDTSATGSFGTLTTQSGYRVPYQDPFTGRVLCAAGELGHRGGDGGQTDAISLYAASGWDGLPGEGIGDNAGGAGGAGYRVPADPLQAVDHAASGGGGGGAAYGVAGSPGTAGQNTGDGGDRRMVGGSGGAGADAPTPALGDYGAGGGGGNGGGAGGNGAGCQVQDFNIGRDSAAPGQGGSGGAGSPGGTGGGGAVFIYW